MKKQKPLAAAARKRLKDDNLMVRLRTAEFLGLIGAIDPRDTLYGILTESDSNVEVLQAFNGIVMFKDFEPKLRIRVGQTDGHQTRRRGWPPLRIFRREARAQEETHGKRQAEVEK